MKDKIQAIRGMNDILPNVIDNWHHLEKIVRDLMASYGYQEIRTPLLESTDLFKRTIGEVTDIVEKEMYTFQDLNGESLSLRPEGTASCVRAGIEHGLLHNQQQKLWYLGPMFRHERPQKGRYRQFHQFGIEVFGVSGTAIELELLLICQRLWQILGISKKVHLEINTLGKLQERQTYRDMLVEFFYKNYAALDEDSKRRLEKNPLRILDSKNPDLSPLLTEAPQLLDYLSVESQTHFNELCAGLKSLSIPYTLNPHLVRGLDYYSDTVFEWVTTDLGSQGTVCAGGRYDNLVEQLGGSPTPAIGLALGMERLVLLNPTQNEQQSLTIYMINDNSATLQALRLAEEIRHFKKNWKVITHVAGGGFKTQFKKADKSGARLAIILGEDEVKQSQVAIKDLRVNTEQRIIPQEELLSFLQQFDLNHRTNTAKV